MEQSYGYIQRRSTQDWAHKFLVDLKRSHDPIGSSYEKMGIGFNWQIIKIKPGFLELEGDELDKLDSEY